MEPNHSSDQLGRAFGLLTGSARGAENDQDAGESLPHAPQSSGGSVASARTRSSPTVVPTEDVTENLLQRGNRRWVVRPELVEESQPAAFFDNYISEVTPGLAVAGAGPGCIGTTGDPERSPVEGDDGLGIATRLRWPRSGPGY